VLVFSAIRSDETYDAVDVFVASYKSTHVSFPPSLGVFQSSPDGWLLFVPADVASNIYCLLGAFFDIDSFPYHAGILPRAYTNPYP
jgi:hypothetical protein